MEHYQQLVGVGGGGPAAAAAAGVVVVVVVVHALVMIEIRRVSEPQRIQSPWARKSSLSVCTWSSSRVARANSGSSPAALWAGSE